ncbi:hypothetical protein C8F04DRAFT_97522 [Mycena alexandri]|uniref:Uncharacterized protein n=1 Tax=Mycena alexandri TaxID=1745969 RepID=A0AAD6XA31_9AGAR|nr:hypothetical protein C8F04DRAFT_97522 [Mycena alexandri]
MTSETAPTTLEAPRLPLELERDIFEIAALSFRSSIPAYLQVAHRIHEWIEPILYNTLMVQRLKDPKLTESTPTPADCRTAEFLASNVHRLNIYGPFPHEQLHTLLDACKSTRDLALWVPFPPPNLLPFLQAMPLERLSVDVAYLFGGPLPMNFAHPAFAALTHLDVQNAVFDDWRFYTELARAPALTHLSFRDKFHPRVLRGALAHCAKLRALGVIWSPRRSAVDVKEGEVVDARFFMVVCEDALEEWEVGARGGRDIWARAEPFIAKKEAGEIKVSLVWLK